MRKFIFTFFHVYSIELRVMLVHPILPVFLLLWCGDGGSFAVIQSCKSWGDWIKSMTLRMFSCIVSRVINIIYRGRFFFVFFFGRTDAPNDKFMAEQERTQEYKHNLLLLQKRSFLSFQFTGRHRSYS